MRVASAFSKVVVATIQMTLKTELRYKFLRKGSSVHFTLALLNF